MCRLNKNNVFLHLFIYLLFLKIHCFCYCFVSTIFACLFLFAFIINNIHPTNLLAIHPQIYSFIHSVVHSFIQTTKQTTIHSTKQLTKTTVSETNRPSNNYQANLIIIPEISSTPSQQPTPVIPGLPNNRKPHYPLERESS